MILYVYGYCLQCPYNVASGRAVRPLNQQVVIQMDQEKIRSVVDWTGKCRRRREQAAVVKLDVEAILDTATQLTLKFPSQRSTTIKRN